MLIASKKALKEAVQKYSGTLRNRVSSGSVIPQVLEQSPVVHLHEGLSEVRVHVIDGGRVCPVAARDRDGGAESEQIDMRT